MSNDEPVAETPDAGPSAEDRFLQAYGRAMLTWQRVETALFRFYFSLFCGGNLEQIGVAYYSLNSFGAKLHLVSETAETACNGQQRKTWTAIHRDLKAAADERNILAHRPAAMAKDSGPDIELVLAPPCFAPKHLRRKLKKRYDAAECHRLADLFEEIAGKIDRLCADRGAEA